MSTVRSVALFLLGVLAEIDGVWVIRQRLRERRGDPLNGAGVASLDAYGFVALLRPISPF